VLRCLRGGEGGWGGIGLWAEAMGIWDHDASLNERIRTN